MKIIGSEKETLIRSISRRGFSKDVDGRKYKLITLADMYA
jgi:hypothetical protein